MRALKAFLLGALAIGVVAYALAAAAAVAAQAGGRTLDVALGPLRIVSVVPEGPATRDDVRPRDPDPGDRRRSREPRGCTRSPAWPPAVKSIT